MPSTGECVPYDIVIPNTVTLTIDCKWSTLFKSIFGWFLAVYTIVVITSLLFTSVSKEV